MKASFRILAVACLAGGASVCAAGADRPPNVVLIFADDLGYGDLGCYGAKHVQTPNIDRLAAEGVRFTEFYVAASVCSPSRAALLTGRYPQRAGLPWCPMWPRKKPGSRDNIGLDPAETTIAEMLKQEGYATLCVGKWHLGHLAKDVFHPMNHGFDEYYGVPENYGDSPQLWDGRKIVEQKTDPARLTEKYTRRVIEFIQRNQNKPFLVYYPSNLVHVPVRPGPRFKGSSRAGDYGDVVQELDGSVGEILTALMDLGLDRNTLVIFASDNGPLPETLKYGSAGPLHGSKFTSFEGGQRVPCLVRWPGAIPAGRTSDACTMAMDWLPTIAHLAGAPLPQVKLDGCDIWPLLSGKSDDQASPEVFYYYNEANLQAIRWQHWKLHLPRTEKMIPYYQRHHKLGFMNLKKPFLVDLRSDVGESQDVSAEHPDVVSKIETVAVDARRRLGDVESPGTEQRPVWESRKQEKK